MVSPDHRNDDGISKLVEFLVIHLEVHFRSVQQLKPALVRQLGDVKAELADRERSFHLLYGTIALNEQRLSIGHKRFRNGTHVYIPPCGLTERLLIDRPTTSRSRS